MKVSTRARYALRAMMDLAMHNDGRPVLVKNIAERQKISGHYLEQILISLKVAGLVSSVRGAGGGFYLARQPSLIRLSEIMQVVEGTTAPVACVDVPDRYARSSFCAARDVWVEVKKAVDGVLESFTLEDIVNRQREREAFFAGQGKDGTTVNNIACEEQ
jgi:Rrf2 family cysteine metabolism transcriptional repressor